MASNQRSPLTRPGSQEHISVAQSPSAEPRQAPTPDHTYLNSGGGPKRDVEPHADQSSIHQRPRQHQPFYLPYAPQSQTSQTALGAMQPQHYFHQYFPPPPPPSPSAYYSSQLHPHYYPQTPYLQQQPHGPYIHPGAPPHPSTLSHQPPQYPGPRQPADPQHYPVPTDYSLPYSAQRAPPSPSGPSLSAHHDGHNHNHHQRRGGGGAAPHDPLASAAISSHAPSYGSGARRGRSRATAAYNSALARPRTPYNLSASSSAPAQGAAASSPPPPSASLSAPHVRMQGHAHHGAYSRQGGGGFGGDRDSGRSRGGNGAGGSIGSGGSSASGNNGGHCGANGSNSVSAGAAGSGGSGSVCGSNSAGGANSVGGTVGRHGSASGAAGAVWNSEHDVFAAQLDASAADAVGHGDPVMLALLLTSWANSLEEAAALHTLPSAEALAFEGVFLSSNALQIVCHHVLFRLDKHNMVHDDGQSGCGAKGRDAGANGYGGQTVGKESLTAGKDNQEESCGRYEGKKMDDDHGVRDEAVGVNAKQGVSSSVAATSLAAVRKSFVALVKHVVYGSSEMLDKMCEAAGKVKGGLSPGGLLVFDQFLDSLRAIENEVRAMRRASPSDDVFAEEKVQEAVQVHRSDRPEEMTRITVSSTKPSERPPRASWDDALMLPLRMAIARLHAEISTVLLLQKILATLPQLLPCPSHGASAGGPQSPDPKVVDGAPARPAMSEGAPDIRAVKLRVTDWPSGESVAADPDRTSRLTAADVEFLSATCQLAENAILCDIECRKKELESKLWPALVAQVGRVMYLTIHLDAEKRLAELSALHLSIETQLEGSGLGVGRPVHVTSSKHACILHSCDNARVLMQKHLDAIEVASQADRQLHVLLTSMRAIGVASVSASVVPPRDVLEHFASSAAKAFAALDRIHEWSFAPQLERVCLYVSQISIPKPRSLRFEEPGLPNDSPTDSNVASRSAGSKQPSADDVLGPGVSPAGAGSQRHRPRHQRMKSSPDELLHLHTRLDTSDDEDEMLGVVDAKYCRPNGAAPGVSSSMIDTGGLPLGTSTSLQAIVEEHEGAGKDPFQVTEKNTKIDFNASGLPEIGTTKAPSYPIRLVSDLEDDASSDGDDGMIVHEDPEDGDLEEDLAAAFQDTSSKAHSSVLDSAHEVKRRFEMANAETPVSDTSPAPASDSDANPVKTSVVVPSVDTTSHLVSVHVPVSSRKPPVPGAESGGLVSSPQTALRGTWANGPPSGLGTPAPGSSAAYPAVELHENGARSKTGGPIDGTTKQAEGVVNCTPSKCADGTASPARTAPGANRSGQGSPSNAHARSMSVDDIGPF